jgi:hypothetical protein
VPLPIGAPPELLLPTVLPFVGAPPLLGCGGVCARVYNVPATNRLIAMILKNKVRFMCFSFTGYGKLLNIYFGGGDFLLANYFNDINTWCIDANVYQPAGCFPRSNKLTGHVVNIDIACVLVVEIYIYRFLVAVNG